MSRTAARTISRPWLLLDRYFEQSERPLHSLIFVLPLIVLYQFSPTTNPAQLIAFELLDRFFRFFGASGLIVPPLAVVGILLVWHLARGDKWEVNLGTLLGMLLESALLTLPLFALAVAVSRFQVRIPLMALRGNWLSLITLSMGAGVYEELVFRLMLLTTLHFLLVDLLRVPEKRAILLMVTSSAILFSFYHYLGYEQFAWKTCLFRTIAGIYFATLFLCRGFGITAGCHFTYDALVVLLTVHT